MDQWDNLHEGAIADPRLFGIADCMSAGVFFGDERGRQATITVTAMPGLTGPRWLATSRTSPGQAYVYKAETLVYFVGLNDASRIQPCTAFASIYNMDAAGDAR